MAKNALRRLCLESGILACLSYLFDDKESIYPDPMVLHVAVLERFTLQGVGCCQQRGKGCGVMAFWPFPAIPLPRPSLGEDAGQKANT